MISHKSSILMNQAFTAIMSETFTNVATTEMLVLVKFKNMSRRMHLLHPTLMYRIHCIQYSICLLYS